MLTPSEADRLLLFSQAELARSRQARGLKLNAPEATALIADAVCEWARDGLDLPTVRERASRLLTTDDVLPGVSDVVPEIRVEARFDDGTRLVVISDPFAAIAQEQGASVAPVATHFIELTNTARTAIGISSHIHLAEINPRIRLDRAAAFGMRLAQPTGDALWILPSETVTAPITPIRGERVVVGNSGVVDGSLDDPNVKASALDKLRACGYLDIVDGVAINTPDDANNAVAALMQDHT